MGTTADKLQKLAATKADLKAALAEKGQTVGDVFSEYPAAIRAISSSVSTQDIIHLILTEEDGFPALVVDQDFTKDLRDTKFLVFAYGDFEVNHGEFILALYVKDEVGDDLALICGHNMIVGTYVFNVFEIREKSLVFNTNATLATDANYLLLPL